MTNTTNGWIPARVGCHWAKGECSISTYHSINVGRGYALYRRGSGEIGRYPTFAEAMTAGDAALTRADRSEG